ncbi:MAG TPA: DUF6084 family protein [Gemmatimonadaceae bacterium]|jgi:hypothetical protein
MTVPRAVEASIADGPLAPSVGEGRGFGPPTLSFAVTGAGAEPFAAAPTLRFDLVVTSEPGVRIRSLLLNTQIRIDAARRSYATEEQVRLVELFGTAERWGETLRGFLWTHATSAVPPFEEMTTVKLLVPCTYDFDVAASKYLSGLANGDVPLELLFSGSVFYDDAAGRLQTARLSWESEARYRMPVAVWKDMIDHYFPDSSWLRLRRDAFERLYAFKADRALTSWDDAVTLLLDAAGRPVAERSR